MSAANRITVAMPIAIILASIPIIAAVQFDGGVSSLFPWSLERGIRGDLADSVEITGAERMVEDVKKLTDSLGGAP